MHVGDTWYGQIAAPLSSFQPEKSSFQPGKIFCYLKISDPNEIGIYLMSESIVRMLHCTLYVALHSLGLDNVKLHNVQLLITNVELLITKLQLLITNVELIISL